MRKNKLSNGTKSVFTTISDVKKSVLILVLFINRPHRRTKLQKEKRAKFNYNRRSIKKASSFNVVVNNWVKKNHISSINTCRNV